MKLRLTLIHPNGRAEDVTVVADSTVPVGRIATEIAERDSSAREFASIRGLTLSAASALDGAASFTVLDPLQPIGEAPVASGALVRLATRARNPDEPGAEIRVVRGPDQNLIVNVPQGTSFVGRSNDNEIVLSDSLVSKHHARVVVTESSIEIVDMNSANGLVVAGDLVPRATLHHGEQVELGQTLLSARLVAPRVSARPEFGAEAIRHVRSPRVEPRFAAQEVTTPAFPTKGERRPFPLMAMLAPLALGIVMYLLTQSVLSLLFVALSPVLMLSTWFSEHITEKKRYRAELAAFDENLRNLDERLTEMATRERIVRDREAPGLASIVENILSAGPMLWTRRPEHWSFLMVRLGTGTALSRTTLAQPSNLDVAQVEHRQALDVVAERHECVTQTAIVESLPMVGALGIAGSPVKAGGVSRGTIIQIAGLHSPAEVVFAAFVGPSWANELDWIRWLPHVNSPQSPVYEQPLADNTVRSTALLSRLEELVDSRDASVLPVPKGALGPRDSAMSVGPTVAASGNRTQNQLPQPTVVVLVTADAPVDRARLLNVIERGASVGVFGLWMGSSVGELPASCRTYLHARSSSEVSAGFVRLGQSIDDLSVESLTAGEAVSLARHLARIVDSSAIAADSSDVPRTVGFLDLVGREAASVPSSVVDRWTQNGTVGVMTAASSARYTPKLRALVGQTATGAMALDLRNQGPHALVGGTTGAGKSEFLQAWVLGMATEYSPSRVTFLFVDYKGGSAFAECTRLPHCVGLVTDLSPHLVHRALTSLRAELHYREHLLNRKKAKDLLELEGRGDLDAPPALVIVIDEFAALVNEVPEFVDGVVDIAQRGRSLGIHLIMATQRPAGVIRDNLRANTNLRIALRMADESDSQDVIDTKDAAFFDPGTPGRGIAKSGPGRLIEFQSAYAGGWSFDGEPELPITIASWSFSGETAWEREEAESGTAVAGASGPNDQQRVVDNLIAAMSGTELGLPRRPWLDEMEPIYDLADFRQRTDSELLVGISDFPERQEQTTVYFRPDDDGNMVAFGTGGAGKSTFLRTLAVAAGMSPSGGPVHVYGLDFAAGGLAPIADLPHVGAIIPGGDVERVQRLFRMLRAELERRSAEYAAANAGSLPEFRELPGNDREPRILLLIDGYPQFRQDYESVRGRAEAYTTFEQIIALGRSLGLHVVLTADRGASVPGALTAMIQRRIVFRLSDQDAYLSVDAPRDVLTPTSPPGRAILDGHETQVMVVGGSSDLRDQLRATAELADVIERAGAAAAPPVGALPAEFGAERLPLSLAQNPVLGIAEMTLEPLPFLPTGPFVLGGPPASGRTNALIWLATSVRRADPLALVFYFGNARSPLIGAVEWAGTATTTSEYASLASDVEDVLKDDGIVRRVVVVFEDVAELAQSLAESALTSLVQEIKRTGQLLIAESEISAWTSSFGLPGEIKSARRGLLLQPDQHDGDFALKTDFPRVSSSDFPPGRGIYVERGKLFTVQLPLVVDEQ